MKLYDLIEKSVTLKPSNLGGRSIAFFVFRSDSKQNRRLSTKVDKRQGQSVRINHTVRLVTAIDLREIEITAATTSSRSTGLRCWLSGFTTLRLNLQVNRVLLDWPALQVLRRLPEDVRVHSTLAYLDVGGRARETRLTGHKRRLVTPGASAACIYSCHSKLIRLIRLQASLH